MLSNVSLNVRRVKNIVAHVDFFMAHVACIMRRVKLIYYHVDKINQISTHFNQIESLSSMSFTLKLNVLTEL